MNDNVNLDSRYFDWLCGLIGANTHAEESSYTLLCEQLFQTEFHDWLPNDYNRSLDGKDLRDEFLGEKDLVSGSVWRNETCSIFEMLIALGRRVVDHNDGLPSDGFWLLISNLELDKYTDNRYNAAIADGIADILDMLNDRTYERDGRGGLFPLTNPPYDQREAEIWDQMSVYLVENFNY